MVLLDEEGVEETGPVVLPSPALDGPLLSGAEAGERLAGVEEESVATGREGGAQEAGLGGRATKGLEEVEGSPLARQEGTSTAGKVKEKLKIKIFTNSIMGEKQE